MRPHILIVLPMTWYVFAANSFLAQFGLENPRKMASLHFALWIFYRPCELLLWLHLPLVGGIHVEVVADLSWWGAVGLWRPGAIAVLAGIARSIRSGNSSSWNPLENPSQTPAVKHPISLVLHKLDAIER
jgi:hypothetical protein